ncbi:equilibrative nucleotide transporter 3-like protein [Tanacetum coccineum]
MTVVRILIGEDEDGGGTSGRGGIGPFIAMCVISAAFGLADEYVQGGMVGDWSFMRHEFSFLAGLAASGAITSGLRMITKGVLDIHKMVYETEQVAKTSVTQGIISGGRTSTLTVMSGLGGSPAKHRDTIGASQENNIHTCHAMQVVPKSSFYSNQLAIAKETDRQLDMETTIYPSSSLLGGQKDATILRLEEEIWTEVAKYLDGKSYVMLAGPI